MNTKTICVDLGWAMARVMRNASGTFLTIVEPRDEDTQLPSASVCIIGEAGLCRLRDALTEMLEGQKDKDAP